MADDKKTNAALCIYSVRFRTVPLEETSQIANCIQAAIYWVCNIPFAPIVCNAEV
jgi:hypothetical protein